MVIIVPTDCEAILTDRYEFYLYSKRVMFVHFLNKRKYIRIFFTSEMQENELLHIA